LDQVSWIAGTAIILTKEQEGENEKKPEKEKNVANVSRKNRHDPIHSRRGRQGYPGTAQKHLGGYYRAAHTRKGLRRMPAERKRRYNHKNQKKKKMHSREDEQKRGCTAGYVHTNQEVKKCSARTEGERSKSLGSIKKREGGGRKDNRRGR